MPDDPEAPELEDEERDPADVIADAILAALPEDVDPKTIRIVSNDWHYDQTGVLVVETEDPVSYTLRVAEFLSSDAAKDEGQ